MRKFINVDGHSNLVRDRNSGAILNINSKELEKRKKIKAVHKQKENEIQSLKNDVDDLKQMLAKVLEKLDG